MSEGQQPAAQPRISVKTLVNVGMQAWSRWKMAGTRIRLGVWLAKAASRVHEGQQLQVSDDDRRRELRAAFDAVDVSGDGELDYDELHVLLKSLGQEVSGAEIRDTMRQFDTDGNGAVDFAEFSQTMIEWKEKELQDMFVLFDEDSSGSITLAEMWKSIQSLGMDLDEDQFRSLVKRVDKDGSGEIDSDEFVHFMRCDDDACCCVH